MTNSALTPELMADIQGGRVLALRMHNEVIVPIPVRMFAIALLAAEFAVMESETIEEATALVDGIADAARSAFRSGFAALQASGAESLRAIAAGLTNGVSRQRAGPGNGRRCRWRGLSDGIGEQGASDEAAN